MERIHVDFLTLKKVEFHEVRRILGEFCATPVGKALAGRIGPSRNPDVIRQWLRQVSQMVAAAREVSLPPLAGVTDVTDSLAKAHPGGAAGGEDFAAIGQVLEAAANVRAYLNALPDKLDALKALADGIGSFDVELRAIRNVIAPDGTIRDDASERLLRIRQDIQATARKIHEVIYGYLQDPEVARLLQDAVVTLHGDRYVLPVKIENRGRLPGVVHRASNTGATVFVEPNACVELNNQLSDLYDDERREKERLLNQLAIHVQARATEIVATLRNLAQIDLIAAKAQYAYQFEMTCPEVTERGPLQFAQARHPLLIERARREAAENVPPDRRHPVVPIDVRLGGDFDLLVITGSNTGGKTVALKTVALLTIMAQSGMHIPVQPGATMPVFRDVFADIGDEQSLQQSLSTFGAHVKRIGYILRKTDRTCLVLLDELGAGTDPDEGGAIGQAVLDELRRIGCLGMVTTHLSILKAYAMTHDRVDNASVEFDPRTMRPTYHLRIGQAGESHAIEVARFLGMPKPFISAARRHLSEQGKQFARAIRATGQVRQVAEEARAQAIAAELAARQQQEVYEAKLADLHRLQREFETWLATLPELRPGDEVLVPSLNKTGRLARLELHRQIALVDTGNIQVEVPLTELMPDLGQAAVREQIAALRQQILQQARETEGIRAQAERARDEYRRSLEQQRERARQFDHWLGAIARVKVGDEVPIARKPGKGTLVKVDLPGLRATVQVDGQEVELSIQDLFPQTGPFAQLPQPVPPPSPRERAERAEQSAGQRPPRRGERAGRVPVGAVPPGERPPQRPGRGERAGERVGERPGERGDQRGPRRATLPARRGHREDRGMGVAPPAPRKVEQPPPSPEPDRPMVRGQAKGHAADEKRQALLALQPGDPVFVVPFHKRATLIRLYPERDNAVVQSGIFELQIPLSDLEPIRVPPAEERRPPKPKRAERDKTGEATAQGAASDKPTAGAAEAASEPGAPPAEGAAAEPSAPAGAAAGEAAAQSPSPTGQTEPTGAGSPVADTPTHAAQEALPPAPGPGDSQPADERPGI